MKNIEGYNVRVFTNNVEENAIEQIKQLLSIDVFSNCKIRIMPDVHAGAGCVIGFTGDLGNKVIPNIVGVDIGCGILVQPLPCIDNIDFHALNEYILKTIPSGQNLRDANFAVLPQKHMERYSKAKALVRELHCYRELKEVRRLNKSIGTLGGGNHFIELDKSEEGEIYLVIHTGSRNVGKQVAQVYQKLAMKCQSGWAEMMEEQNRLIAEYKQAGRKNELQEVIRNLHNSFKMRRPTIHPDLAYLEGTFRDSYLYDMHLCQEWAQINRRLIADLIVDFFYEKKWLDSSKNNIKEESFESIHNYIGDDNIIRKGAISAYKGKLCIIPINMRDGSLICVGKGNEDWNYSAPHGAGRVMSRSQAFKQIKLDDYIKSMSGIYSETITETTKDESPMVYKPMDEIIKNIQNTVEVVDVIKPIFNFKAVK